MVLGAVCVGLVAFIFGAYAIPHLYVAWFHKTRNLKKAYGAEWALVTGASSGAPRGRRWRCPCCRLPAALPRSAARRWEVEEPPGCARQLVAALVAPQPPLSLPTRPPSPPTLQASARALRASWRGRD